MLNRALRVLFPLLLLIASPAFGAGTIPLSMTQQLDQFGVPLSGCALYTIQAGTTSTPQNAYKDTALSLVQPNPMICDSSGRLPQFFLADGQIKIRLLDKLGNPQVVLDNILVIGPSSGGGSGATIDPTTIASTGDIKHAYGTQVITGWVRFNGRTIGNATSGATERANADTQALFLYLWAADATLTVSGGRTTAAADYAANKTIALPDFRSRALAGLGDMGNSDNALFSGTTFTSGNSTTLGSLIGAARRTLAMTNLPASPAPVAAVTNTWQPTVTGGSISAVSTGAGASTTTVVSGGTIPVFASTTFSIMDAMPARTVSGNTANLGSSTPFDAVSPYGLVTIYIKL